MGNGQIRQLIRQIIEETNLKYNLSEDVNTMDEMFKTKLSGTQQSKEWSKYLDNVLRHAQYARNIDQLTTMHLLTLKDVGHSLLRKVK